MYCSVVSCTFVLVVHVSGAGTGAENAAERARKSDERERDLKKYGGAGAVR